MIESALLWYGLFSTMLVDLGFEINLYEKCTENKEIFGSQCIIGGYDDDNRFFLMENNANTITFNLIKSRFVNQSRKMG